MDCCCHVFLSWIAAVTSQQTLAGVFESMLCRGQDLSLYINEVKRDHEIIEQIDGIQRRSVD